MKTYFLLLALVLGLTDSIFPCKAMADPHNPEANTVRQTTHRGTHVKFSEICDFY